jgi:hypothetical protein
MQPRTISFKSVRKTLSIGVPAVAINAGSEPHVEFDNFVWWTPQGISL